MVIAPESEAGAKRTQRDFGFFSRESGDGGGHFTAVTGGSQGTSGTAGEGAMFSRLALRALAPAGLKSSVALPSLSTGIIHASRSLHTSQKHLAPVPSLPEKGGKVRYGIIPEEFFQFLYPKTGVTGPYMLAAGLTLYFLSKEIYVINHETISGIVVISFLIYGIKKYGPVLAAFLDKKMDEELASYEDFKAALINRCQEAIEEEKKEQWRLEGRKYLFDAKRNNIAMILETNYRERLLTVSNEVKKRLDYQVALQQLKRHMERDHMINWIEQGVWQSITAQQEKENIAKCLLDLKALSKSAQASL